MSRKLPQSRHRCERCGETKPRYQMCISTTGRVQPICKVCIVPPEGMKWCSAHKCHEPLENFGINRASPDGLAAVCKGGKRYYDDRRRAESIAARSDTMQDDLRVIECGYCCFEVECRGMLRQSFAEVRRGEAPALGDTLELPCVPGSPRYPEYTRFLRHKRQAAERKKKFTPEIINHIMTLAMGD